MIAAVVQLIDFVVLNIIVADANVDLPPDGCELIDITNGPACNIGWVYDPANGTFSNPGV
jgi:hypothetical protein